MHWIFSTCKKNILINKKHVLEVKLATEVNSFSKYTQLNNNKSENLIIKKHGLNINLIMLIIVI